MKREKSSLATLLRLQRTMTLSLTAYSPLRNQATLIPKWFKLFSRLQTNNLKCCLVTHIMGAYRITKWRKRSARQFRNAGYTFQDTAITVMVSYFSEQTQMNPFVPRHNASGTSNEAKLNRPERAFNTSQGNTRTNRGNRRTNNQTQNNQRRGVNVDSPCPLQGHAGYAIRECRVLQRTVRGETTHSQRKFQQSDKPASVYSKKWSASPTGHPGASLWPWMLNAHVRNKKTDWSVRKVDNICQSNKTIKRVHYPLLRIQDVIERRQNYTYFTKVDISRQHYCFYFDEVSSWYCYRAA